jgi:hypothetical protein
MQEQPLPPSEHLAQPGMGMDVQRCRACCLTPAALNIAKLSCYQQRGSAGLSATPSHMRATVARN